MKNTDTRSVLFQKNIKFYLLLKTIFKNKMTKNKGSKIQLNVNNLNCSTVAKTLRQFSTLLFYSFSNDNNTLASQICILKCDEEKKTFIVRF